MRSSVISVSNQHPLTNLFQRGGISSKFGGGAGNRGSTSGSVVNTGANKSSMLEQEMKAIRKIKEKQKKEIEQLVDYEVKMNLIKSKNEENMKKQADKEARHAAELEEKRNQQELKKL